MIIKPFKALFPNFEKIASIENFFNEVKEDFPTFNRNGFFSSIDQSAFYIYQICQNGKEYNGILSCLDVGQYLDGRIKKHEDTISEKEKKQLQLLLHREAAVKPVTLTYPTQRSIQSWINNYLATHSPSKIFELGSKGKTHKLWSIHQEEDINRIQELFQQHVNQVYIADGHHRIATTSRAFHQITDRNYDCFLCALFPTSDMEILDYNRIVKIPEDLDLINILNNYFDVEVLPKGQKPERKFELTLYFQKRWFKLSWKDRTQLKKSDKIWLDAEILNDTIIQNILKIEDVRKDPRISYIEGTKGIAAIEKKINKNLNSAAFCLFPIALNELLQIADAGEILPPKSTWFEPRMINGMIVLEYE